MQNIEVVIQPELSLSVRYASREAMPVRWRVRTWVRTALEGYGGEIGIRFVDEEQGQQINAQYRGKNQATNVLSFSYDDMGCVCGDIIVCAPIVCREAEQLQVSLKDRCAHMVVHGVLHLLGFNHVTAKEASIMQAKERELLARCGVYEVRFE